MLIHSELDQRFWAEAVNTACYLINKFPYRGKKCTPEGKWSGRKPTAYGLFSRLDKKIIISVLRKDSKFPNT